MNALVLANGTHPPAALTRRLARNAQLVVCADGGANRARALGITPDAIVGDFDSITAATRKFFKNVLQIRIREQESTDLEKALRFLIQRGVRSADILGATGDRIDHTTGNLGCFKKFARVLRLRFVDRAGELTLVQGRFRLDVRTGETISLIPLERCSGVTTKNLKYPVKNGTLELGVREGISNVATGKTVTVSVRRGSLLLYRLRSRVPR
jgi:thiamine pyrophosphokinase